VYPREQFLKRTNFSSGPLLNADKISAIKCIHEGQNMAREEKTISVMIGLFCRGHHKPKGSGLCPACTELLAYAKARLDKCPFGDTKGPCSKCIIHCYNPDMRKRIIEVMKYSGLRMLLRHPILAMRHLRSKRTPRAGK
jgi:hypothetical protein